MSPKETKFLGDISIIRQGGGGQPLFRYSNDIHVNVFFFHCIYFWMNWQTVTSKEDQLW